MSIYNVNLVNKVTGEIKQYDISNDVGSVPVETLLDSMMLRKMYAINVALRECGYRYSAAKFDIVL